jgi:hypothetical protein
MEEASEPGRFATSSDGVPALASAIRGDGSDLGLEQVDDTDAECGSTLPWLAEGQVESGVGPKGAASNDAILGALDREDAVEGAFRLAGEIGKIPADLERLAGRWHSGRGFDGRHQG